MAVPSEEIEQAVALLTERLRLRSLLRGELTPLRNKLPRVARSDAPVVLRGARGPDAERVARALHYLSPRAGFAFVSITCGNLPEASLRRALFGPETTPADLLEPSGLVHTATGGTLFLNGVEHLSATAQGRLLRWLREKTPGAARFICAAKADLQRLVEQGQFRPDLYYRINVICLTLRPSGAGRHSGEGTSQAPKGNGTRLQRWREQ